MPLDSEAWHHRVAVALAGEGRFTGLMLALFAEATGTDVAFLTTGEQRPVVRTIACRVDDVGGYADATDETASAMPVATVAR